MGLTALQSARAPAEGEAAALVRGVHAARLGELLTQNLDLFTREQLRLGRFGRERLRLAFPFVNIVALR